MARRRVLQPRGPSRNACSSRVPGSDTPIPSIEKDGPIDADDRSSARSPTPSISVDTPDNDDSSSEAPDPSFPNSSSPSPGQGDAGSIGDRLQDLRLTSPFWPGAFALDNLRAALPSAGTSSRSQTPLLLLPSASPGSSGGHRRRRSSSVNPEPYDVRQERPPQDRFHDPEFQQAFAHATSLMARLAGVLGSSTLHLEPDSTMKTLRDRADALAHFRCPPTRTVALVGDSGVGKSSLLNSLLDFRNLARTSNGGSACTCVVTEYRHHDRADFAVEVVLFTEAELTEQLRKMVQAYRHNFFYADQMSNEDRNHSADQATLACDTLKAMFADRFTTAFLENNRTRTVVETLMNWAMDLRPARYMQGNDVAESLEDCSNLLMRLTSDRGAAQGGPAAWPYIKKIRVFLNAYILSRGLVLVDLPGLRDLNSARRNITERYLLECDEIFAVCPIGRAMTDEGVKSVCDLARQTGLSNVSIICTKSDEIRVDEAQRDWEGAQARELRRLTVALATAEQDSANIRDELDDLRDLEDISEEDEILRGRLYEELERKNRDIERRKFERQRYMITTRNTLVQSNLRDLYRDTIPGGDLHVFCASNTLYWENRDLRPQHKAAPFLELSGIVTIRKHCMSLVSQRQLRIATQYLQGDIPGLLGDIELWVQTGAGTADAEKKRAVREALDRFGNSLREELVGNASPLSDLTGELTNVFREHVYQRRQIREWTEGAIQAGQVWSSRRLATYAAFCRQYGTHTTDAAGYHCWNEEAMGTINHDLADPWDRFQSNVNRQLDDATAFVSETLDRAISRNLANALQEFPEPIRPLWVALKSRKRILAGALEDLCASFSAELSKLRTDALSGLRTAYFGQSMEQAYWNANLKSGRGSWERKKAVINEALRDEQLFANMMRKLKRTFEELAAKLDTDALALVEEHLGSIDGTLDMVRSENVALESERDPEFRTRVGNEVDGLNEAMDPILAAVGHA
ncbi:hypothetical protein C8A05DRAFT_43557 [Staphylotrichum tortipilum]|uniref:Uncharacterized protein n=1 Tax=Staphylotrichum tortipilum TaxID=2831512 RepID=A0AAN6MMW5_9PEZI|nr:hypothetical protein C8A05DRAFT_43557 [Staphylotrichum longicolle]